VLAARSTRERSARRAPRRGVPRPLRSAYAVSHDLDGLLLSGPCGVFRPHTPMGLLLPCAPLGARASELTPRGSNAGDGDDDVRASRSGGLRRWSGSPRPTRGWSASNLASPVARPPLRRAVQARGPVRLTGPVPASPPRDPASSAARRGVLPWHPRPRLCVSTTRGRSPSGFGPARSPARSRVRIRSSRLSAIQLGHDFRLDARRAPVDLAPRGLVSRSRRSLPAPRTRFVL
jgi:hypothetical protein